MMFWTIVKVGLKSLWANKLRSFLAMLGIIIGVGAVISMLSLVAGASSQAMQRISSMGTNLLVVRPGQSGFRGVASGQMQTLTLADALAIVEVSGVQSVAPGVSRAAQVKYLNRNTRTTVLGTAPTYLGIRDFAVGQGRLFTATEADHMARVAVLGPVTAENLFSALDPIGEVIKINGVNFKVIGILESKGDQGFFNPDDQVIIPYTTAMKQLFGVDYLQEIDVAAVSGADLDQVAGDITALLRKRHRIQADAADDFRIQNQADILRTASDIAGVFSLLLGGIAGISLVVGGIGIMNIMLVTVTERTREIGIRKAIGAKERNILLQFLLEAVVICGLGGIFGVVLGVVGALIIRATTTINAAVTPSSVILAVSFAALVGIFFGFYPARRAAALDPVDALRYE